MKKFFIFLIALMLISFSGCGWEVKIVNPDKQIIESEANIKTESEPETPSVPENESEPETPVSEPLGETTEKAYSHSILCKDMDFGHTGSSCFSGGKLWFSTYLYGNENSESSGNFIFSVDLDSGEIEKQKEFSDEISSRFFDDHYGNVYHLISENIPLENSSDISDKYKYDIVSVYESKTAPNSLKLEFDSDFLEVSDVSVDLNGNMYFNNFGDIRIFNRNFEEIFRKDSLEHYLPHSMLRLPDGRVAAVFDENGFEIRIFDPETFEFSERYPLSLEPNSLYSGNSEYDIIFTVIDESYQNLLYGLDFGKEPEFIMNLNEYIEGDFAVLNAHINENGNIFAVLSTDKLRYGATEIYKFEINK